MGLRFSIPEFQLANAIYASAIVTCYTVDGSGDKTATKATLYESPVGSNTVANPQTLDSEGKWAQPVYADEPIIAVITGISIANHDTGIMAFIVTPRGDWASGVVYAAGDIVRDGNAVSVTYGNLYIAQIRHLSGALFNTDLGAGKWGLLINAQTIATQASAAAAASANSALASAISADNSATIAGSSASTAVAAAAAAAASAASINLPSPVADTYLRRNAANNAYETKTAAQVLSDLSARLSDVAAISQVNGRGLRSNGTTWVADDYGHKNVLVNGQMRIAQRGTSFAAAGQTLDQWFASRTGGGMSNYTVEQSTDAPPGFKNSARLIRAPGDNSTLALQIFQSVETLASLRFAGLPATLSFWAKLGASASAAALNASVNTGTGTDQSLSSGFTGALTPINESIPITTSWARYSATGTIGLSATQVAAIFGYTPVGTAGADDSVYITGCQLEVGGVRTDFDFLTMMQDYLDCARFYQQWGGDDLFEIMGITEAISSTQVVGPISFLPMRAAPSISVTGAGDFELLRGSVQLTGTSFSNIGKRSAAFTGTVASGLTTGQAYSWRARSTNARIKLNASI